MVDTQTQLDQRGIPTTFVPVSIIPAGSKHSWVILNIGSVLVNVFPYVGNLPMAAPEVTVPLQPNRDIGDQDTQGQLTDGWAVVLPSGATAAGLVVGMWR